MYENTLMRAEAAAKNIKEGAAKELDTLLPAVDPILESLGIDPVEVTDTDPVGINLTDKSSHYSTGQTTSIEEKALRLLGSGVQAEAVASALGVTASRISQLLAEDNFSKKVANLRYESLQKHNRRDTKYDSLEDRLIDKLEKSLPLLVKPESILKAITVVNGAKRRGQSAPAQVNNQQNIVNLVLPASIAAKFTVATNIDNQVTRAGDQELLTMASGNLLKQVEEARVDKPAITDQSDQSDKPEDNL